MKKKPQPHSPAATSFGCFSGLLGCLLCGGTVTTHSSRTSVTLDSGTVSTKFIELLKNDPVSKPRAQVPIVAKLMGLETPVDMSWVPKSGARESFGRSRSVNSVDYLIQFNNTLSSSLHRRVKTSVSFREVPLGDFLVVCLENIDRNATTKKRSAKEPQKEEQAERKTERARDRERIMKEQKGGGVELVRNSKKTTGQTHQMRTYRRSLSSDWQQRIDNNVRKPKTRKTQSIGTKTTQKELVVPSKSRPKVPKQVKSATQSSSSASSGFQEDKCTDQNSVNSSPKHTKKKSSTISAKTVGHTQPRSEERRSRRKSNIKEQSVESYGELMMKRIKWLVEEDFEDQVWSKNSEAPMVYKEDLGTEIEVEVIDELVGQMVYDLASTLVA